MSLIQSGLMAQISLPIPMLAITIDLAKWRRANSLARHAKKSSLPKMYRLTEALIVAAIRSGNSGVTVDGFPRCAEQL
jgi:hypothetical protein